MRAAIDLVYRAIVRAATEIPDRRRLTASGSGRRSATGGPLAALQTPALAQPEPLVRTRRRPRRPPRAAGRSAISCAGGAGIVCGELEQQRAQQVRAARRSGRAAASARPSQGSALAAQVEAAHVDRDAVDARVLARRRDALALVVEREHRREAEASAGDREHARAGADVEQRAARRLLARRARAAARGTGACVACAPVPNACRGVDHDLLHPIAAAASIAPASGGSHGGRTCRAARPTSPRPGDRGGRGASTAPAESIGARRGSAGESAASARASRRPSRSSRSRRARRRRPRCRSGRLGQLAGRAVDRVLDDAASRARTPRRRAGASSSSSASTSSACSRRTRTARRITQPGCRARVGASRTSTRPSAGSPPSACPFSCSSSSRCSALRRRGIDDVDDDAQVAAPSTTERGHALAAQRQTSPGCVPAGSSTVGAAFERRHLERAAERGERRRDVERGDQIVAFAHEALVVASRGRARTGRPPARRRSPACPRPLSLMRWPSAIPAGTSTSSSRVHRTPPAPAALAARLLGHAAVAVADVAGDRAHHLPERRARRRLQLPGAAAALARLDRRARLGAVAVAVLAALDRLVGDLDGRAVRGLEQVDLDRHARCRRPAPDRGDRRSAAPPPKNASNRSPIEPKRVEVRRVAARAQAFVAVAVVRRAPLRRRRGSRMPRRPP